MATDRSSVLLMGVAGSGKTTVGRHLAPRLGAVFVDADDHHAASSIARMRRGEALSESDRRPWLEALHRILVDHEAHGRSVVLACSALRRGHREYLGFPSRRRRLVYLAVGRTQLAHRLEQRAGHFFDPALLADQLDTLEPPEAGHSVAADAPAAAVVERVLAVLASPP